MTNRLSRTACYVRRRPISIGIGGFIAPTSASAVTTLPALSDGQGNPVCFEDPRIVALGDGNELRWSSGLRIGSYCRLDPAPRARYLDARLDVHQQGRRGHKQPHPVAVHKLRDKGSGRLPIRVWQDKSRLAER